MRAVLERYELKRSDSSSKMAELLDENYYFIMPPERNSRPCQIPIYGNTFRYLTNEFIPGSGRDNWVMFHHPGHFMFYDRKTRKCIVDASYGMIRDYKEYPDDEIVAVIFEMRLLLDEKGHEDTTGWDIVCELMNENKGFEK